MAGRHVCRPCVLPPGASLLTQHTACTHLLLRPKHAPARTPRCSALISIPYLPCPPPAPAVDSLGLDYLNMGQCAGILVAYIFICRFIAYLGVRFLKH